MSVTRHTFKLAASALDVVARPAAGVTVLIYHRVGRHTPVEVDLPTELFERQIEHLCARHEVVSLDEALARLTGRCEDTRTAAQGGSRTVSGHGSPGHGSPGDGSPGDGGAGRRVPGGEVAVTFDDGTADFASDAMPVLERHKVPVTLFVATSFVESQRMFPDQGRPLSWSALADCTTTGLVTVGSHTHTHALLDRAGAAAVRDELDRSIDLIGEHLGAAPAHFAYPKAVDGSPEAAREVKARFASAALAGTKPNPYGRTDPYRLMRSPVQISDGMEWFARKASGGLRAEDAMRRALNKVRYRTKSA